LRQGNEPPPRSPKLPLLALKWSATAFHRELSKSLSGTEERSNLMPQPQSETAHRRQSSCRVRTAVPAGSGDLPGQASGKKKTCSARRSCGIHECSPPRGSADKLVIFTASPPPNHNYTSRGGTPSVPADVIIAGPKVVSR